MAAGEVTNMGNFAFPLLLDSSSQGPGHQTNEHARLSEGPLLGLVHQSSRVVGHTVCPRTLVNFQWP